MEQCDLDLRLSVFEGTRPDIKALMLHARLRAENWGSLCSVADYLVLCRHESGCTPTSISVSEVTDQDVVRLTKLLNAAGFPKRAPRVVPNERLLGVRQYVALDVKIQGHVASLSLTLEHGGFSGEDAEPVRALLYRLSDLTPSARRPAVRSVVDHLISDGRDRIGPEPLRDGLGPRSFSGAVRSPATFLPTPHLDRYPR